MISNGASIVLLLVAAGATFSQQHGRDATTPNPQLIDKLENEDGDEQSGTVHANLSDPYAHSDNSSELQLADENDSNVQHSVKLYTHASDGYNNSDSESEFLLANATENATIDENTPDEDSDLDVISKPEDVVESVNNTKAVDQTENLDYFDVSRKHDEMKDEPVTEISETGYDTSAVVTGELADQGQSGHDERHEGRLTSDEYFEGTDERRGLADLREMFYKGQVEKVSDIVGKTVDASPHNDNAEVTSGFPKFELKQPESYENILADVNEFSAQYSSAEKSDTSSEIQDLNGLNNTNTDENSVLASGYSNLNNFEMKQPERFENQSENFLSEESEFTTQYPDAEKFASSSEIIDLNGPNNINYTVDQEPSMDALIDYDQGAADSNIFNTTYYDLNSFDSEVFLNDEAASVDGSNEVRYGEYMDARGSTERNHPLEEGEYQRDSAGNNIPGQGNARSDGSVSLAFVFDSTGSMWDDLEQVKYGAQLIMETMLERDDKPIHNYVLVPFHDPVIGPVTDTTDHQRFRQSLQDIAVQGGGDCPEMSVGAIKQALEVSLPNSYIYVFTDATGKDYRLLPEVLRLIQRKQSQVVFVMTGDCGDNAHVSYQVYEKIASTSSGQVFHLNKTDVKEVMDFVKSSLQTRHVNLLSVDKPSASTEEHSLSIDETLQEFTVSVSGLNPQIDVVDPGGKVVDSPPQLTPLLSLENVKVVNVKEPEPGQWKVTVSSESEHSVRSTGKSDFDFTHGFAVVVTDKMAETYHRPLKGTRNSILIQASNVDSLFNLTNVKIIDLKGKEVEVLPLYPVRGTPGLYRGKLFVPNNEFFYLAVEGVGKDGSPVKRISNTAISSQKPEPPIVHMQPEVTSWIRKSTTLSCVIESLVPFTVAWFKDGAPANPSKQYKQSAEVLWHIASTGPDAEGNYTCQANNLVGKGAQSTYLTVTGLPPIVETQAKAFAQPNGVAVMDCSVKSELEYKLSWAQETASVQEELAGSRVPVSIPLQDNFKTKVLNNGTLVISYVSTADEGWYVCSAENRGGQNSSRVFLAVSEPVAAKVKPERFDFHHGSTFQISCVASGRPTPTLRWTKDGKNMQESNRRNYIEQKNGLDLKVTNANEDDEGMYQCVAENDVDIDVAISEGNLVEAPTVIAEEGIVLAKAGQEAVLKCVITGRPQPIVTWLREDTEIISDSIYQVQDDGTLKIVQVQMSDKGEFSCVAENQLGKEKDFVILAVGTPPKIILAPEGPVNIDIGTSGHVPCMAIGFPEPEITWRQVNTTRAWSDRFATTETGNLHISEITTDDEGTYLCTAENVFGKDEAAADVKVTGIVKPILDSTALLKPETIVARGERLELPCRLALGNPRPSTTWYRDGEVLDTAQLQSEGFVLEGEDTLVVNYAQREHQGLYECVASNVGGTVSQATAVDVLEPPSFQHNEQRVFKVNEGSELVIPCEVNGYPNPFITWDHDRMPLLPSQSVYKNQEDNSLVITEANEADTGTYTCTATNAAGTKQKAVVIAVQVPPMVFEAPETLSTTDGSIVTLTCHVRAVPLARITWYRDDILVSSYRNDVEFLDNSEGIRFVANVSDTGKYKCVATNEAGSDRREISLTVMVPPSVYPPEDERHRATSGQDVVLNCHVSGYPVPNVTWTLNGVVLDDASADGKLSLVNVSTRDAGNYVCDAENDVGITQKIFYLQVNVPPKILEELATRIKLMEGEDYSVPCTASGIPTSTTSWRRDGKSIIAFNEEDAIVLEDGTLVLVNVSGNSTGMYTCTGQNGEGSDQRNYVVEVLVPPVMSDAGETKLEVMESGPVVMMCPAVEAIPAPKFRWLKDGRMVDDLTGKRSGKAHLTLSENGRTLTLQNSRPADAGTYTCIASNLAGRDNATFKLDVMVLPNFKAASYKRVHRVLEGDHVELHCAATGRPPPRVSWKKNNVPVTPHTTPGVVLSSDKQTLHIHKARLHDGGLYHCAATNKVGRKDRDFEIKVLVPPEIEGPPEEHQEIIKGANVMLQCPMTGVPEPTVKWRKLGDASELKVTKNVIISKNKRILELSTIRTKDDGIYICEGTSEVGSKIKRFNVTVLEPPYINQGDFTEEIKVPEGKQTKLTCTTRARPKADVVWLHNGHMLDLDKSIANSGRVAQKDNGDEHVLTILGAKITDGGKYTCLASNEAGVAEKSYRIKILVAPRLAKYEEDESNNIESIEGLPITIRCPVEGHPNVDIHWMKDSQPLEAGDDAGHMLRISNSRPEHSGNYTCVAGNPAGNVSKSFHLNVLVPPSPNDKEEQDNNYKLTTNDTLRLVCNVSGHPHPQIFWLKGVAPISSLQWLKFKLEDFNRTLILPLVSREHSGQYSCLAINMAGTTEIAFNVQVQEPPKMDVDTSQLISNHTVKLHRRLVLKCPLSGFPQPNISWYKDGIPVKSGSNVHLSSDGKQLHLMQALTKNAGEYDCVAENVVGTKKLHFNVDVVVPAEWSSWSDWSECSAICGTGEQVRVRFCHSAERNGRTENCQGESEEWRECKMAECQIDGGWSNWSSWTSCSESCGRATRRRYRKCDSPLPAYGGQPCLGSDGQQEYCHMPPCPVDGKWSQWTDWSDCTTSCGKGTKQRSRQCNNPTPAHNGDTCNGPEVESLTCNHNTCPQHGNWATWGQWTPCSTTCGPGNKKRHRMCSDPPPKFGGGPCVGENLQIEKCIARSCDKIPLQASLRVKGKLNGETLANNVIAASISDYGPKRTVTASMEDILKDQPGWFPYLAFLLSPVSWNTAYEMDMANNGYSLTNGNFRQKSQIEFATGHQMMLRHVGRGIGEDGALQVDIEVEGDVPIVQPEANVLIDPFEEDYVQTGPSSLYVSASNSIRINGRRLPYSWNNSVSYDNMQGTMPYLVEKLTTRDIDTEYDPGSQQLRYMMSTEIGRKFDSNRCLEGFESDDQSPHCRDLDECRDLRLNRCHSSQICENLLGSYRCFCQPGFKSTGVGKRCLDVNECIQDTNACSHECLNIKGSYRCMCPQGWSLLPDGKTCSETGGRYWQDLDDNSSHYGKKFDQFYEVPSNLKLLVYAKDRGTNYFEGPSTGSQHSLRGVETWNCPQGYNAVNGICLDTDECSLVPSVCSSEQTCLNTKGTYKCLETPCPNDFVQDVKTGSCIKFCDRPGVYCADGALYTQTLSYNILELDSDNVEPYEDLMPLKVNQQNGRQLHKTRYRIIENEKGKPFRVRTENGQGLLYTLKPLVPGKIYRITVLALTYEESGKNVLYTTRFIIYIQISDLM